jgi:hypothetical protein
MVSTVGAWRCFGSLARKPRLKIFAHCRENEALASDVAIKISDYSLRLPRSHAPTSRCFPLVRDFLRSFAIGFFCAPLNAPTIRQRYATKPKLALFSLPYTCHPDNHTDNIHECPKMFSVVSYERNSGFA